ncbi:HD domain-containing protein [Vibrio sp. SM6]|uniref:HD domain-containing protein n=1 Tax=Vibrio agarilyticus TaxID=2726741 RepID=A0A7X8TT44_9VIBR|nr:TraI domain-containing protein [Vibrio agarilyticus]NLS14087.1 HD domain-containing protein [Vibrio agarilyticus]
MRAIIAVVSDHLAFPVSASLVKLEGDFGSVLLSRKALAPLEIQVGMTLYIEFKSSSFCFRGRGVKHAEVLEHLAGESLIKSLPFSHSSELREGYRHLTYLIREISHPDLHSFKIKLQNDQTLLKGLLTLPASYRHHHSYASGLLIHSLEVAYSALGSFNGFHSCNIERQLLIIGALFHDIGKTAHYLDTGECRYIPNAHESCNIGIMYTELQALHKHQPLWYEILMTALQPSTYLKKTVCVIADAVHYADRLSAAKNINAQIFSNCPSGYYFSMHDNRRYLRSIAP